ncbi:hypothetical protein [Lactobacillus ultunensis]|uniref:Uncharacterized protein n=1 Tax=Lactobacillus ultunensis DSM 16047 TaxID=525365 RepID=C2EN12_9LACO|nr:hypothetical protein [Lactobacillus ultunensis]EEJ72054.1 hypothetical protein HMPREF0548_1058 [Lactobacillus ultunensis DSM 16047]KRL82157.1 hypothetical protein FC57_GL002102 [Lactobacillus ultunensis DSM 16047]QQP29610.1 hypothetical protein H4B44_10970 [Lactobacillus ultunensis]
MDEKLSKEEKGEALTFISIILPVVGIIIGIYYLIRREKRLALRCLLWALAGIGINMIIKLIFNGLGQQRPLIDLSIMGIYSPIVFSAIFAFVFYDFIDWIKLIWLGWGALVTSVLYVLLPLLQIKHIDELVVLPLVSVFAFACSLFNKTRLKNWQSMLIALIIMIVWGILLFVLTGLICDL